MTAGLILLVFIGLLIAFFLGRGRRRLGISPIRGRTWLVIVAAVVLLGLALWASSTHR